MRFSLRCLINAGLAPIEEVIVQSERIMQLNDVVNIFLVNDVLNVVNYEFKPCILCQSASLLISERVGKGNALKSLNYPEQVSPPPSF